MKGNVKANTVDRYLRPIRNQIRQIVEPDSIVVEYGCGNGDLLFKLADKIQWGVGLDRSEKLIDYAKRRHEKEGVMNLEFKVADAVTETDIPKKADYSISSLLFHLLTRAESTELLNRQLATSRTLIICGFSEPKTWKQSVLLWLDQRFTRHYSRFRKYRNQGFTEGLLSSLGNIEYSSIDTFDPVIKIYKVNRIMATTQSG